MEDVKHLEKICGQLEAAGRLKEILDSNGEIRPSKRSLKQVKMQFPNATSKKECAEAWRLAQAQTLLDLADKYQNELN